MALYDAKIEKFSKKAEQLERNIKRDTIHDKGSEGKKVASPKPENLR